jgi:hypothetical protein
MLSYKKLVIGFGIVLLGSLPVNASEAGTKLKEDTYTELTKPIPSGLGSPIQKHIASFLPKDIIAEERLYEEMGALAIPGAALAFLVGEKNTTVLRSAGYENGKVLVVDTNMKTGKKIREWSTPAQLTDPLFMSGNGEILVSGKEIFSLETGEKMRDIPNITRIIDGNTITYAPEALNYQGTQLALSPNSKNINAPIILFSVSSTQQIEARNSADLTGRDDQNYLLQFSKDGNTLNYSKMAPDAYLWDTTTGVGKPFSRVKDLGVRKWNTVSVWKEIPLVSINRDGKVVAFIDIDNDLVIKNLTTNQSRPIPIFRWVHGPIVTAGVPVGGTMPDAYVWRGIVNARIGFTDMPDILYIVSQNINNPNSYPYIELWNTQAGTLLQTMELRNADVFPKSIAVSSHNRFLACGYDDMIKVFRKTTVLSELEKVSRIGQIRTERAKRINAEERINAEKRKKRRERGKKLVPYLLPRMTPISSSVPETTPSQAVLKQEAREAEEQGPSMVEEVD